MMSCLPLVSDLFKVTPYWSVIMVFINFFAIAQC